MFQCLINDSLKLWGKLMRVRKSVRLVIINQENELLLSRYDGVDIFHPGEAAKDHLWETIGGGIDEGETLKQAALRECYEEAGLTEDDLEIGQQIWSGETEIIYNGEHLIAHHTFLLARTKRDIDATIIQPMALTAEEDGFLTAFKWWPMAELSTTDENIIPPLMKVELPKIIKGELPNPPLILNLDIEI